MHRVTLTIDDELMADIDRFALARGYQSRSEAVRDLARGGLAHLDSGEAGGSHCVAALVYVYDHTARELSKRLATKQHEHHDLITSTLHVHLDHDTCMEVAVMQGRTSDVKGFADHVIAERGVQHGQLVIVPVDVTQDVHSHGGPKHSHEHVRVKPSR